MTHQQLKIALANLSFLNKPLKEQGSIDELIIKPNGTVTLKITYNHALDSTQQRQLRLAINKLIKITYQFKGVQLSINFATPQKTCALTFKYLAIVSGKGGVGKSTTCYYLAEALQSQGYKVGLMDADIFGASIPQLALLKGQKLAGEKELIIPQLTPSGIQVVSTHFLINADEALVWRAPMIQGVLDYFFNKTLWDKDLDVILIDMPPGTGDILIDVINYTKENLNALLVTTPDMRAAEISLKSGLALSKVYANIIGVVENMSYLDINKKPNYLFGQGGGEFISNQLSTPLLAQIPLYLANDVKNYVTLAKTISKLIKL